EHDHAADALADPGVQLVDLRVELGVRVALEQLVAALLGRRLRALEQERVDTRGCVRLRERDRLRVGRLIGVREELARERETGCRTGRTDDELATIHGTTCRFRDPGEVVTHCASLLCARPLARPEL